MNRDCDGTLANLHTVPCGCRPNLLGEVSAVLEHINRVVDDADTVVGFEGAMRYMRWQGKGLRG
jgi:hypothetical protein